MVIDLCHTTFRGNFTLILRQHCSLGLWHNITTVAVYTAFITTVIDGRPEVTSHRYVTCVRRALPVRAVAVGDKKLACTVHTCPVSDGGWTDAA